jgi:hypothetical protein
VAPSDSTIRRWLLGTRRQPQLLPGRPLDRASSRKPGVPADDDQVRAICCSGGGIRAAAFALGGMQALGRRGPDGRSWYEDVDLVTAVSGGSYMAGSFAIVDHHLTNEQRAEALPYAPGSPEDNRLRAHTRYLVEDPRVAAIGILNVLYGLLLNLLPLLGIIFISAKLLGWLLFEFAIVKHSPNDLYVHHTGPVGVIAVGVAALGIALFAVERVHDVYRPPVERLTDLARAWALRLLILAAYIAVGFVAVPLILHLLSTSRFDLNAAGVPWGDQLGGFVATIASLVALVKGSVGKFKAKLQTSAGTSSKVAEWTKKVLRWLAPWAGSAIALGLLIIAFLTWTTSAAYDGLTAAEVLVMVLVGVGVVAWQAVTDVNRNSIHPFYKERLSSAFAVHRNDATDAEGSADPGGPGVPGQRKAAAELDYSLPIRLSEFGTALHHDQESPRRPELIVCAAVNTDEEGVVPAGRGCAPFTFSSCRIGISSGTMFDGGETSANGDLMLPTRLYEEAAGIRLMTLPAAVAVSGAAVSPAMGRMTRAPLRLLLGLANVRLGLWLPNPRHPNLPQAPPANDRSFSQMVGWQLGQPGILSLMRELAGRTGLRGRWIYVTDGGHYENLGLVEALRRGATQVIVFDASGDAPHSWTAFGEAVETARADLGVQIDLNPEKMAPPKDSDRAPTVVVKGTCTYPDGVIAEVVLCKLAMPADVPASWDVAAWASVHANFPHDSTAQQLYGDREFEAYRRLGELGGEQALAVLNAEPAAEDAVAERFNIDLTVPIPLGSNGDTPVHVQGYITREK